MHRVALFYSMLLYRWSIGGQCRALSAVFCSKVTQGDLFHLHEGLREVRAVRDLRDPREGLRGEKGENGLQRVVHAGRLGEAPEPRQVGALAGHRELLAAEDEELLRRDGLFDGLGVREAHVGRAVALVDEAVRQDGDPVDVAEDLKDLLDVVLHRDGVDPEDADRAAVLLGEREVVRERLGRRRGGVGPAARRGDRVELGRRHEGEGVRPRVVGGDGRRAQVGGDGEGELGRGVQGGRGGVGEHLGLVFLLQVFSELFLLLELALEGADVVVEELDIFCIHFFVFVLFLKGNERGDR